MRDDTRAVFYSLPREIRQHYLWKIDLIESIYRDTMSYHIVIHRIDGYIDTWALTDIRWELREKAA
jgi:hypothetical protein